MSRDQYAGYIHGLGVTLAVVSDPELRSKISPLAAALADHLIDNDLKIIDWDGERPRSASLWVSDPYRLVGYLGSTGEAEHAGIDYLIAYWLGRYHGFIGADE